MDASEEDGSLGRILNDDHKKPNCKFKVITVNNRPHLCLFAISDISPGQELTYGNSDWPWRTQVKKDVPLQYATKHVPQTEFSQYSDSLTIMHVDVLYSSTHFFAE